MVFGPIGKNPSEEFTNIVIKGNPHVLVYGTYYGKSIAIDVTTLQSSKIKMQIFVADDNAILLELITKRFNTPTKTIAILNYESVNENGALNAYRNLQFTNVPKTHQHYSILATLNKEITVLKHSIERMTNQAKTLYFYQIFKKANLEQRCKTNKKRLRECEDAFKNVLNNNNPTKKSKK